MESNPLNKKFQKELLSGISSLVLLSVVGRSEEPMYGYQITKMLDASSGDTTFIKQGALYPVLRSLEKSGLLSSSVEPSVSGPPRRYYVSTDLGKQTLSEWETIWQKIQSFTKTILQGVEDEK
jgi:PadR family transcriptional regulator, regulatory protein PadR